MSSESLGDDEVDSAVEYIYNLSIELQNQVEEDLQKSEPEGSIDDVGQARSNAFDFPSLQSLHSLLPSDSALCRCVAGMVDASHEVLYVAKDLIYNAIETRNISSETVVNAALFVACKVADLSIVRACIEITEKKNSVIRWRRMRSILGEAMLLVHDHLIKQFENIQEHDEHQNFLSQYRQILLELISDAFKHFLLLLHLADDNCPEVDRGNRIGDENSNLPEAYFFVAVLSQLFSSNLLQSNYSGYAEFLYRCPINVDAILLHPYRLQKKFKFDHVSEVLTNVKLGWDAIGLAKVVEELYCSCRTWPSIYSHTYTWKLVYPHTLLLLENKHDQHFLAVLDSRMPIDLTVFSVEQTECVVADTKVLVDALIKSSSISNFVSSRQIHGLIKSIICHRCCSDIRLGVGKKLIQHYFEHESCGSILPLFLDLLKPISAMPGCSIENITSVLEPFINEMSETSSLGDDQLMEMHEVYLSVSALILSFVKRYKQNGGSFLSDAIKVIRSFYFYIKNKITLWESAEKSDAPANWFRLYLLMDGLQLLLSNWHED